MRMRVRYSGRVQGVGFRATAQALASRHPVTGWVRNEPDGDVLLEIQGARESVNAALGDIAREMQRHIRTADRSSIGELADEARFEIRR